VKAKWLSLQESLVGEIRREALVQRKGGVLDFVAANGTWVMGGLTTMTMFS
jgi:hypothetical protein